MADDLSSSAMERYGQNLAFASMDAPQNPDAVLKSFAGGNHEMALLVGEKEHKEAYVQKYGYEQALGVLDSVIKNYDSKKSFFTKEGIDEIKAYKNDLLSRQQF